MEKLIDFLNECELPDQLTEKLLGAVYTVEKRYNDYEDAFVLFAEKDSDEAVARQKYNMTCPEFTERIETHNGAWEKSVYIYSDSGEGIVFFSPVRQAEEKS